MVLLCGRALVSDLWVCLQGRVDALVGVECLYCGDMMIRSIDKPFIPHSKAEEALRRWK